MRRSVLAFAVIAMIGGQPWVLAGQSAPQPGARVRVTAPACGFTESEGPFRGVRSDTLVFGGGECPLTSLTGLQVHTVGNRSGRGALFGALVGGSAAWLALDAYCDECGQGFGPLLGVLAAVPGALVGALAGSFVTTERWAEVPLERLRVGLEPRSVGAVTVGFSLRP